MIDLKRRYGDRYRIKHDECFAIEPSERVALQIIPCRHGHLYPHSKTHIGAATKTRGPIAKKLTKVAQVVQDGDDGINAIFPAKDFGAVAAIMQPHRKRRVSQAERERLARIGAATRKHGRHPGTQSDSDDRQRVRTALAG